MSEPKTGNPFLRENFAVGGGLWDGKVVTITKALTELIPMAYGDGSPVINDRSGKQSIQHVLSIVGIAEDGEGERKESYSAGQLLPTADGEGFLDPKTGTPGYWTGNSNMAKFSDALVASGYDAALLYNVAEKKIKVSVLVGCKFRFTAVPRLDKNGKQKINKKGYDENDFYPVEYLGKAAGVGTASAATPTGAALVEKATDIVVTILAGAGGKVSRADLVKKVSQGMVGDSDAGKVIALIAKDDFHKDKPWTRDGTGYTLAS